MDGQFVRFLSLLQVLRQPFYLLFAQAPPFPLAEIAEQD